MPIVISDALVLSETDDTANNPVILYRNLVTTSNVDSTSEDADFPITNVANPATHLKWVGGTNLGDESITVVTNYLEPIDGLGVARHNFGSENIVVSVDAASSVDASQKVLLDFQGTDASTTITDTNAGGSPHTWTAAGNAQLDTAQSPFFGSSLLLDGTGDWVTTPDHADFTVTSKIFTIGVWARPAANGTDIYLAGQGTTTGLGNRVWSILRFGSSGNHIQFVLGGGAAQVVLEGTTAVTAGAWWYIEVVGDGTTAYLFINGALEASGAISFTPLDSAAVLNVGRADTAGTSPWNGWVGQFAFWNEAKHTAAFTRPNQYYDQWDWFEVVGERMLADDTPLLLRFEPDVYQAVRLRMQPGDDVPTAAVVYLHKLLVMERSIDVGVQHTPINLGRKSNTVNGKSTSGNFLGRIMLGETRESAADFKWITSVWYRANFDPFVVASQEDPFFWAWNPTEQPNDVGYCWTLNDPIPDVDPVTRRIAVQLKMQGVA